MQKWNYAQQVGAARLRHLDPVGAPAEESRRLSERMDMLALAEQYPAPAIAVAAQDEFELSRRDVAAARLVHRSGTPQELVRASTAVQMADYKRQREAPVLAQELGIELPTATE